MAVEIQLDAWSYTLIAAIISILVLLLFLAKEPDTHPLALEHQAQISHIRQPKESAIYRSHETPHGASLKTGLALPGEKHWQKLDGDIRDVWNLAVEKGNGKILGVKASDVTSIETEQITKWIISLGTYLTKTSAKRIAILLPNDVENIVASFACHFYNLPLILIPHKADSDTTKSILVKTNADVLITSAGILPLSDLESVKSLQKVIWVVEEASKQLDWSTPPGSRIQTKAYHEILEEGALNEKTIAPPETVDLEAPAIITSYVPLNTMKLEIIEFTHKNIVAGIAAQLSGLPPSERLTKADTFLPIDTLSALPARIATYAALTTGSLLALTPTAHTHAAPAPLCRPVSPTVIFLSPESTLIQLRDTTGMKMELWHSLIHFFQRRTLTESGTIPRGNWFTRFNDYVRPQVGIPENKLRLAITYHNAITDSQPINSPDLADFRIYLACKIVYQLHSPKVAGPICKQNVFDYRVQWPEKMPSRKHGVARECAHFGPPTPAVEVFLRDTEGFKVTDKPVPRGQVWVRGASVAGREGAKRGVGLGVVGRWRADGCLEFTK